MVVFRIQHEIQTVTWRKRIEMESLASLACQRRSGVESLPGISVRFHSQRSMEVVGSSLRKVQQ